MRPALAPFIIAGGGIGGLAVALTLARQGQASCVLERRAEPEAAGAGIQLGPNGVGVLERLGLGASLEPLVARPEHIAIHDARRDRELTRLPLGAWMQARHGASYWTLHRADLHASLYEAAQAESRITLFEGVEVTGFRPATGGDGVAVTTGDGHVLDGRALIGADGVWSSVRRLLHPEARPRYSGKSAARIVVPRAGLDHPFALPSVGLWLAPGAHVVHYPVRAAHEVAFIVVVAEDWRSEDWSGPVDPTQLLDRLHGLSPRLIEALGGLAGSSDSGWRKWALAELPELPHWSSGRVTLLGDAAHPVLPFLAQGGALALEDAEALAAAVKRAPYDPASAFRSYEQARRRRALRVQQVARRNGRRYHWPAPLRWGRDLTLRLTPAEHLLAGLDWLYGWPRR